MNVDALQHSCVRQDSTVNVDTLQHSCVRQDSNVNVDALQRSCVRQDSNVNVDALQHSSLPTKSVLLHTSSGERAGHYGCSQSGRHSTVCVVA